MTQPVQQVEPTSSDSDSDIPVAPKTSGRLTKVIRDANLKKAAGSIATERSIEAGRLATLAATATRSQASNLDPTASDSDNGAVGPATTDQSSAKSDASSSSESLADENHRQHTRAASGRQATPASDTFSADVQLSDIERHPLSRPSSAMDTDHSSGRDQPPSPSSFSIPSIRSPLGPGRVYHRTPPRRRQHASATGNATATVPKLRQPSPEHILVLSSDDEVGMDEMKPEFKPKLDDEPASPTASVSPDQSTAERRRRYRRIDELQQAKPFLKAGAYHEMKYFPRVDDPHVSLRKGDLPHPPTVVNGSHGHLFPGMTMQSTDRNSVKKRCEYICLIFRLFTDCVHQPLPKITSASLLPISPPKSPTPF